LDLEDADLADRNQKKKIVRYFTRFSAATSLVQDMG
jgi:hypothetical protein